MNDQIKNLKIWEKPSYFTVNLHHFIAIAEKRMFFSIPQEKSRL